MEREPANGSVGEPARGAVDVGTNTMRLLVVDEDGATITRELRMVRLGEGVDANGHLADAAIERAMDAFTDFRDRWRNLGLFDKQVVLGATSAVRDAVDRDRFLDRVRESAPGVDVRVLTGEEEADGAFRGVAASLPDATRPRPSSETESARSAISSAASRRAVATTSSSSSSTRPPGNDSWPGCERRSRRRRVNTSWRPSSGSSANSTSTAAMRPPSGTSSASSSTSDRRARTAVANSSAEGSVVTRAPDRPGRPPR